MKELFIDGQERLREKTKDGETLKTSLSGQLSTRIGLKESEEGTVLSEYREGLEPQKTSHLPRALSSLGMKLPLVQKQGWKRVGGGNQYIDFFFVSHWPNPLRSQKARTSGDAALRPVPQAEDQNRKRVGYGS